MISTSNLLWIIPVCILTGVLGTAFFISATTSNRESEIYDEGVREGERRALIRFEDRNND